MRLSELGRPSASSKLNFSRTIRRRHPSGVHREIGRTRDVETLPGRTRRLRPGMFRKTDNQILVRVQETKIIR